MSRVDRLTETSFITGVSRINDSNPELPIDEPEDENFTSGLGSYNFEKEYTWINTDWLNSLANQRKSKLEICAICLIPRNRKSS